MPSGRHDDYVLFSSGGQSGQVFAIGVPSMRLLRSISVFTPESWQGYGFAGENDPVRERLKINGKPVEWGDTHHPALSETKGDYDGQFLFIGDKANARLGVIDLRDWETKQIVKNPLTVSDHGAAFVTPQHRLRHRGRAVRHRARLRLRPAEEYKKSYRGMVTMWKFDRAKGRIDEPSPSRSSCRPTGRTSPTPASSSATASSSSTPSTARWRPAASRRATRPSRPAPASATWTTSTSSTGRRPRGLQGRQGQEDQRLLGHHRSTSRVAEGILLLRPEPKSPHGVDVTPERPVHGGRRQARPARHRLLHRQDQEGHRRQEVLGQRLDEYGVPILDFDAVKRPRSNWASGPCTRSSTTRATPTPRSSSTRRWPAGRWAASTQASTRAGLEARAEDPGAVQHRAPLRRRGRHGQPRRQLPDLHVQVVGRSLPHHRPAPARRTSSCSTSCSPARPCRSSTTSRSAWASRTTAR
jgi:hypothetical protein